MDYYWYKLPSFPFHMTTTCYKLKQFFFQIQSQNPQKIMRYFHCTGGKAKTCWLNGVTQVIISELMMSKGQRKHMSFRLNFHFDLVNDENGQRRQTGSVQFAASSFIFQMSLTGGVKMRWPGEIIKIINYKYQKFWQEEEVSDRRTCIRTPIWPWMDVGDSWDKQT